MKTNHSSLRTIENHHIRAMIRRWMPSRVSSWVAVIAVPSIVALSFVAIGSSSPPAIPAIALANEPLYASVTVDKPTLALALSVEFPTVGAQYPIASGTTDNTYSSANEYLGYYDAESCYTYNNAPTETPATGLTTADYKRFDRSGPATQRRCTDAFSGNFLNWATNSAIDMLRLALSGGDRYIDTDSLTILQRAVIPNGDPTCMWNTSNFPAKQLPKNGGGTNVYWGAVPEAMITAANGNDIWVANTLNRIYFGTSKAGDCGTGPAQYTLGGAGARQIGPITQKNVSLPRGSTECASEGGDCSFTGVKEVWYGASGRFKVAQVSNGVACTNAVFGDPISGTAKKCYTRATDNSWTPSTTNTLNSDGFFYSRVQVCNSSGGTLLDNRDYGLCKQYPNGNFKPTGVIQKYSDQMRLAAFGYLMDQTASYSSGRYGGVLRAPMKYVGQTTYDTNGLDNTPVAGNARAEWNPSTGVFYTNPDGDTSVTPNISGVINYLNKFGRTGPVPGRYKKFDPVGELHYEVLRYLQGLAPSADAVSNITSDMKDGFPVYTTWTDPYDGRSATADYSCLKTNIVVIGDINTHDGNRLPTASASKNIVDINYWRGIVQKFEKNQTGETYVDGQGVTRSVGNPNGANNSVPSATDRSQIMGTAYWARTHDIRGAEWTDSPTKQRPGLRVKTILFDVNEYGAQSDANTRRYANQFFMAAKYGGFETDPSNPGSGPYNTFGNPFKQQNGTNNNDVWQKKNEPGEADSYYLQSSARNVLNAFDEIFNRAATASRSIAGGSARSNRLTSTVGTTMYSAKFDTSNWTGDVVAEPITVDSNNELVVGSALWSASARLTNMSSPAVNRKIFIGKTSATADPFATSFAWDSLETSLQTALNKKSPTAAEDNLGSQRVSYLRGDRSKEGNPFRVRTSLLGDIINSNVLFMGSPSKAFSGTGYRAFRAAYDNRVPVVFAGANDGMLHAFNANNGDELFAYIPSWLGQKLSALTSTDFIANHQMYVDAPSVVGEVQVGSSNATASDWMTVLVSGTGAGGSGVFALNVSDPENFAADDVLWEFTRADDVDIGQVVGQPQLIKLRTNSTGTPTYRWFAAVASGVNNYVPDSANRFSTTGNPAIFLLALDKAAGAAWAEGTNYYKIPLPVDATLKTTMATGAVNLSALYGSAGEVTDIFVGDLHGRVWRLGFSGKSTSDWTMNKLSVYNKGDAENPVPYPFFIAKNSSGKEQPITAAPSLYTGPVVAGKETFYVVVGTGKYLEVADNSSTAVNSVYALYDNGSTTPDVGASNLSSATSVISGRGRLRAGTVNSTTKTVSFTSFKWGRASSDTDATQRSGWYFDLPTSGERLVSSISDVGALQSAFNTIIPGAAGATSGSCTTTPGSGNQYVMNITDGAGRYVTSTVGLLGPAMFYTNDAETSVTPSDSTGRRVRTITQRGLSFGQSNISNTAPVTPVKETIGRLSWRQINNYQDMKNAP